MYYFNSTIQVKRKTCNVCKNPHAVIHSYGRCAYCAKKENAKLKASSKVEDKELENFFAHAALKIAEKPYCMECQSYIPEQYYRHATAHILQKKIFRSVACHPLNYLILSAGCGCHEKSHVWSKFEKMRVWPLAVERFKVLYPYLHNHEYQFLPQQLLDTL